MDKNNLNERIAEFMGLKRGVDFGIVEPKWDFPNAEYAEWWRKIHKDKIYAPDYTADSEWGKVVGKLREQCTQVLLHFKSIGNWNDKGEPIKGGNGAGNRYDECRIYSYHAPMPKNNRGITAFGDTIGEAVCRAAVAYLEATKEGGNEKAL